MSRESQHYMSLIKVSDSLRFAVPIVSIVVPFWGYLLRSLIKELVKSKKGTTMETIGILEPQL